MSEPSSCPPSAPSRLQRRVLALTDPDAPSNLSRTGRIVVWGLLIALLLPTLALPLAPDQGVFYIVARKLLAGGLLYRDIVDIKPPLIYHMYAGAIALLGPSAFSIRAMDVMLQLLTCWMLWRLIKRMGGGELAAALSVIVYTLIMLASGPFALAQTESYMGLFALPVVWGTVVRRSSRAALVAGLCCGALTLLKLTFGIVLPGALLCLWWFGKEERRSRVKLSGMVLLGWFGAMLLFVGYLALPGVLDAYRDVWSFTIAYGNSDAWSTGQFLRKLISEAVWQFAQEPSVLFTVAGFIGLGIGAGIIRRREDTPESSGTVNLLRAMVLFGVLIWVSIIVERRFYPYHFERYYIFLSVLSAFGLVWLVRRIASTTFCLSRFARWGALAGLVVMCLYLSPVPTAMWRTEGLAAKMIARSAGVEILGQLDRDMTYIAAEHMAEHIRPLLRSGDQVMALTAFSGVIYERCGVVPDYPLPHSGLYINDYTPHRWREETRRYLTQDRPRFIILPVDRVGAPALELQTLTADSLSAGVFRRDYALTLRDSVLQLYERNDSRR